MKRILYILLAWTCAVYSFAQSATENYIATKTYTKNDNTTGITQIQYFDGLGRPIETVQKGITPSGADLVSLTEYDGVGREEKQWLPIIISGNSGAYVAKTNLTGGSPKSYYNYDMKPYSKLEYEASPLNRVTGQYGVGESWHNNSKKVKTEYGTNTSATEVMYFYANTNNQLIKQGYYPVNTLYKTTITDEDGKTSTEYKDKLGQTVLKRNAGNVDTYYVYNDLGQLSYVLPPNFIDGVGSTTSFDDANTLLMQFGYLYRYDDRGNCKYKRLPGCTPIYMVYDSADRLILSQDGNQRNRKQGASMQWTVSKYDVFGRVIFTGISYRAEVDSATCYQSIRNIFKDQLVIDNYALNGLGSCIPLTVNYYDNYNFIGTQTTLNFVTTDGYDVQHSSAKGLLTGTRTYTLDNSGNSTLSALYYDYKGQVVQSRSTNHMGGYDLVYNSYDFTGHVTRMLKEHSINEVSSSATKELYIYEYDHAGRLKTTTYQLDERPSVILASNTYDELGRLITKKRHNNVDTESYLYNVRNWPTKITSGSFIEDLYYNVSPLNNTSICFNGNIAATVWTYNGGKKAYAYTYDNLNRLSLGQGYSVSGNTLYSPKNKEQFLYDKQGNILSLWRQKDYVFVDYVSMTYQGNQIKSAIDSYGSQNQYSVKEYQNKSTATNEFAYDTNGNMTKDLDRDIVTIKYNLLNLPDIIQFKNGNQIINKYDAGGRKLSSIYFTLLYTINDPVSEGEILDLHYDTDIIDEDGTSYVDNIMYKYSGCDPGVYMLYRVDNPEGYMSYDFGGKFMYNRKDHLGNIREVWRADNNIITTIQRTQYYPSGLQWSEGTNTDIQPFKYNGKEFVEMHGLDEYDSEARWYYPAIMRTTTIDPLAEKYYSISPYVWCGNNPVRMVDPDGRWFWEAKNVSAARTEAKQTGGTFTKWKGQNGRTYASVDYSKSADYKGNATVDVKVFKPQGKSLGEKVKNTGESVQTWVKNNKSELVGTAQSLQKTGDDTALAGLGVAAIGAPVAGVGAAPGLALSAAGATLSTIGTAMEVGVELITGDFSNNKTANAVVDKVTGKIIDRAVKDILPVPVTGTDKLLNESTKTLLNKTVEELK